MHVQFVYIVKSLYTNDYLLIIVFTYNHCCTWPIDIAIIIFDLLTYYSIYTIDLNGHNIAILILLDLCGQYFPQFWGFNWWNPDEMFHAHHYRLSCVYSELNRLNLEGNIRILNRAAGEHNRCSSQAHKGTWASFFQTKQREFIMDSPESCSAWAKYSAAMMPLSICEPVMRISSRWSNCQQKNSEFCQKSAVQIVEAHGLLQLRDIYICIRICIYQFWWNFRFACLLCFRTPHPSTTHINFLLVKFKKTSALTSGDNNVKYIKQLLLQATTLTVTTHIYLSRVHEARSKRLVEQKGHRYIFNIPKLLNGIM